MNTTFCQINIARQEVTIYPMVMLFYSFMHSSKLRSGLNNYYVIPGIQVNYLIITLDLYKPEEGFNNTNCVL